MKQSYNSNQQNIPFSVGSDGQYILYHSNFCINCKEFITLLSKTPLYSKFIKINVSSGVQFPQFVKNVPTIVVPGIKTPLVGKHVFKWLEDHSIQNNKQQTMGIVPYSPGEMGTGLVDTYSYLGSADNEQPMEHTFSFIKNGDQKIETPPEDSFGEPKKTDIKRTPYPQNNQNVQMQQSGVGSKPPMVPSCSVSNENGSVDSAYNELLARRKMDI